MRDIVNAGARLLVISLIAALLLAGTNMITRGPIAEQARDQTIASRLAVMPEANEFKAVEWPDVIELSSFPSLVEAHEAYKDGVLVGYVFQYKPMGYKAEIPVSVGIRLPGNPGEPGILSGISIGDISETSGLGSKVKDEPFLSQFDGVLANRVDADVNTISGATISSSAVKNAVKNAVSAFEALRPDSKPID
ncbi:electron transport complex subunit G [Clostridia bacterium]|nr:electron transport complex subunit G [Clostridia bacterium]